MITKKNKILLITATHGDEPSSLEVVNKIIKTKFGLRNKFDLLIANPKALKLSQRFIEKDLNRCAPGNIKSRIYEEKRAAEIVSQSKKYNFVLDIHASTSNCGIITIIPKPTLENILLASILDIKRNVIWYSKESNMAGPLVQHTKCPGIEIEHGPKNSQKIKDKLYKILVNFIQALDKTSIATIPNLIKNKEFYCVYGKLTGKHDKSIKDFHKVTINKVGFYPFLANQYPGITCYKLKKIDIQDYFLSCARGKTKLSLAKNP